MVGNFGFFSTASLATSPHVVVSPFGSLTEISSFFHSMEALIFLLYTEENALLTGFFLCNVHDVRTFSLRSF